MLNKKNVIFYAVFVLLIVFCGISYADKRSYVWTYEYMTMPKGMSELEYYLSADVHDSAINTISHLLEIEYGVTDRWDVSMYQQFKQARKSSSTSFKYDALKLRTRYRFGDRGKYFIDPLVYFEYIKNFGSRDKIEGKLILGKDIGNANFSYNQIFEKKLGSKTEYNYSLGINYPINASVKLALESQGSYSNGKYYIGPTIALKTGKFWSNFGIVKGLTNTSDKLKARMIIGFLL